ncbi:unnamed protein product, partial [Linum tenue]
NHGEKITGQSSAHNRRSQGHRCSRRPTLLPTWRQSPHSRHPDRPGAAHIGRNPIGVGQLVSYVQCDVTSDADMRNAVDAAVLMHGQLDIMYSNAGIGGENKVGILSVDREVFRKVFDTNVYGSFLAAKHAARVMVPGRSGTILLTASSATVSYGLAPHVYSTSKHTVVGLAKNLCVELGGFGIRVNCVSVATLRAIETSGMGGMRTRKSS